MHSVTSVNLHRFGSGLLVEVVGEGKNDEVIVRSFELDIIDDENRVVKPRVPLAAGEEPLLRDRLTADGYQIITGSLASAP